MLFGGTAEKADLSEADKHICDTIGPELRKRGLVLTGIDVIGGRLTEINVTSRPAFRPSKNSAALISLPFSGTLCRRDLQVASLRDKIRGMNMKLMTVLAVASVAFAGAACSESQTKASPEALTRLRLRRFRHPEPVARRLDQRYADYGRNAEPESWRHIGSARLIGSDQLGSVDFSQDVPAPVFAEDAEQTASDEDDDIIRLDPS